MLVLVTYDVSTMSQEGCRRLRRVAKLCTDRGQRVQKSVFECIVDPGQWTMLKQRLVDTVDPEEDSLRFYYLGKNRPEKVEHYGVNAAIDLEGPMIV